MHRGPYPQRMRRQAAPGHRLEHRCLSPSDMQQHAMQDVRLGFCPWVRGGVDTQGLEASLRAVLEQVVTHAHSQLQHDVCTLCNLPLAHIVDAAIHKCTLCTGM
eukprot:6187035-Amphidinium_carterae.1